MRAYTLPMCIFIAKIIGTEKLITDELRSSEQYGQKINRYLINLSALNILSYKAMSFVYNLIHIYLSM